MTAIVVNVQQVSITIESGSSSATATLGTAVTVANSVCFVQGWTATGTPTAHAEYDTCAVALTNSTTVTATCGVTASAVTVVVSVVQFESAVVNSIQTGTIEIVSAATSATATLGTSVGSNSFVVLNGQYTPTESNNTEIWATVSLNQETGVVTAALNGIASGATVTVGYTVVDLTSAAIASVQQVSQAFSGTATTESITISSVTVADTILVWNGFTCTNTTPDAFACTAQLTRSTNITLTRNTGVGGTLPTVALTAVQFQPGVLSANAVQRGTIALASSETSNTATITSVNTAYAFVNYAGVLTAQGQAIDADWLTSITLTNGTTITAAVYNANAALTVSYEAIEFSSSGGSSFTPTYRRQRSHLAR